MLELNENELSSLESYFDVKLVDDSMPTTRQSFSSEKIAVCFRNTHTRGYHHSADLIVVQIDTSMNVFEQLKANLLLQTYHCMALH